MIRSRALIVARLISLATPLMASAHNAGHPYLPDGQCHAIGSFRDAPLVGRDRTPLDLVAATPMDEYGLSFVGYEGRTPISPRPCPLSD